MFALVRIQDFESAGPNHNNAPIDFTTQRNNQVTPAEPSAPIHQLEPSAESSSDVETIPPGSGALYERDEVIHNRWNCLYIDKAGFPCGKTYKGPKDFNIQRHVKAHIDCKILADKKKEAIQREVKRLKAKLYYLQKKSHA
jgi:hypothetical protein